MVMRIESLSSATSGRQAKSLRIGRYVERRHRVDAMSRSWPPRDGRMDRDSELRSRCVARPVMADLQRVRAVLVHVVTGVDEKRVAKNRLRAIVLHLIRRRRP
jgi:hypothetical protein